MDPFHSWAGMMQSELSRISLACKGAPVVSRNGTGINERYNVVGPCPACILYGARPGSSTPGGADNTRVGYLWLWKVCGGTLLWTLNVHARYQTSPEYDLIFTRLNLASH